MKHLQKETSAIIFALLMFYLLLIIRNAWISDDAIITFRVVENFLGGYGLGYNPYVRVQAFTHPLWMFLISIIYWIQSLVFSSVPNALFYVTIIISILFSLFTIFILLVKIAKTDILSLILVVAPLGLSNSFIDFSTSGLENPLTHFLIAVFIVLYFSETPNILRLSFIASLIMLNRMDAILIVAPVLIYLLWNSKNRIKESRSVLIGFAPFIVWELFSILYFGFLFPNTAYAKLNTGVSDGLLILQGLDYFLNSINWDSIVFFTIGLAGFSLYLYPNKKAIFLYVGTLLYLIYIVKIGGDFMAGRFLTAPLLVSTALISYQSTTQKIQMTSLSICILLGVFSLRSPLWASNMVVYLPTFQISDRNGVSDQRLHYFGNERKGQFNSFVENGFREYEWGSDFAGDNWQFESFESAYVADALGKPGYKKGPNVFVIDNYALSDALLARLPAAEWEIGHFRRNIPEGYIETLESGENQIEDPNLALYYSKLQILITGSIWNWDRMLEIWKFNTGQYDYLIDKYNAEVSK